MRTIHGLGLIRIAGAVLLGGCQLIAGLDPDAVLAPEEGSASSAGVGGGIGGMGATSGTAGSGMGGAGGGMGGAGGTCTTPADCPDPMNECIMATCNAGACGAEDVAADTPLAMQTPGDCKTAVCEGNGGTSMMVDDNDIQDDGMQCTADTCSGGMPMHDPEPSHTPCSEGGGAVCDGMGNCVQCTFNSDCMTGICQNYQCIMINGCSATSATDMTGMASVTVNFGGMTLGNSYDPKCLKVSQGATITFIGSFTVHPLMGGEVISGMKVPASSGPFIPITTSGMNKNFTMAVLGNFPYYCDVHALGGMTGVVFVVP